MSESVGGFWKIAKIKIKALRPLSGGKKLSLMIQLFCFRKKLTDFWCIPQKKPLSSFQSAISLRCLSPQKSVFEWHPRGAMKKMCKARCDPPTRMLTKQNTSWEIKTTGLFILLHFTKYIAKFVQNNEHLLTNKRVWN